MGSAFSKLPSLPPSAAMIRDIIWLPADCTRTHEPLVKHKSRKGETKPGVDRVKPIYWFTT